MNKADLAQLLAKLAGESTTDRPDPWPAIHSRLQAQQPSRSRRVAYARRVWWGTAIAAALVTVAVASGVVLDSLRPRSATAAEILGRMQVEAQEIAFAPEGSEAGCQLPPNPTELTDRVGQILGVSGERVRQAMRVQVFQRPPGSPVQDPMSRIAQELGVSADRVREVFAEPTCPDRFVIPFPGPGSSSEILRVAAGRLGVTPDRLAAAIRASAPTPPQEVLPAPVSPDEMITRVARELGVTPDRLRAALQQAGANSGPGYVMVPPPR